MAYVPSRVELEEAELFRRKINTLSQKLNLQTQENQTLAQEYNSLSAQAEKMVASSRELDETISSRMAALSKDINGIASDSEALSKTLKTLSASYFSFKNISSASKNIAEYDEEYSRKYSYYNELRRITLGYVIGIDRHVHNSDRMRKCVEKAYLQNSDYWLAYAIAATMLWYSNQKEAADRALQKALHINFPGACLYFLLVNLRLGRTAAAKKWYLHYLDCADPCDLTHEWQYLLQAYLHGAFGTGSEFEALAGRSLKDLYAKALAANPEFEGKTFKKTVEWITLTPHTTGFSSPCLQKTCREYESLLNLLSAAEKNALMAAALDELTRPVRFRASTVSENLENALYSLIADYDENELSLVKRRRYSEMVIEAGGEETDAGNRYYAAFSESEQKNSFADLLLIWAFPDQARPVDPSVRRFAISLLKSDIVSGFEEHARQYRQEETLYFHFNIDGCSQILSEDDYEKGAVQLAKYYDTLQNKALAGSPTVWLYGIVTVLSLTALTVSIFMQLLPLMVSSPFFVLMGSFLLCQRMLHITRTFAERKRQSMGLLRQSLRELSNLRSLYKQADIGLVRLKNILKRF